MEISVILGSLVGAVPGLVIWITATILCAIIQDRNGGKAERFLLAGVVLMLVNTLLKIPSAAIVPWFIERGDTITSASSVVWGYGMLLGIIGMASIICMVYGFWTKFKVDNFIHQ